VLSDRPRSLETMRAFSASTSFLDLRDIMSHLKICCCLTPKLTCKKESIKCSGEVAATEAPLTSATHVLQQAHWPKAKYALH
jgi:hypothetical protein